MRNPRPPGPVPDSLSSRDLDDDRIAQLVTAMIREVAAPCEDRS